MRLMCTCKKQTPAWWQVAWNVLRSLSASTLGRPQSEGLCEVQLQVGRSPGALPATRQTSLSGLNYKIFVKAEVDVCAIVSALSGVWGGKMCPKKHHG